MFQKAVLDFLKSRHGERFTASEIAEELEGATVANARKAANYWHDEGFIRKEKEGAINYYWYDGSMEITSARRTYDTRQKREVLFFFKENHDRCFTAEEVAEALGDIGRSTVYRLVTVLSDEGRIIKSTHKGRRQSWQYAEREDCQSHLHIECEQCGRIEHLDEESTKRIQRIVECVTGYRTLAETVFHGLCPDCRRKGR